MMRKVMSSLQNDHKDRKVSEVTKLYVENVLIYIIIYS